MWIDDILLKRCAEDLAIHSWVPERSLVVLGSSNAPETECHQEACHRDGIEILRRAGGGGTVVLHEGCVVVSIGTWVRQYYQNTLYFRLMNDLLIRALAQRWPPLAQLTQAGISDIVMGERKVAGTSLFRSRNYLLYQASLLVEDRSELIERYLAHPSREPDYRKGRGHRAFITCLAEALSGVRASDVQEHFRTMDWRRHAGPLADELIAPVAEQVPHVLARANQTHS